MSKRQWLCILGVWIIIFLFLGFPSYLDRTISVISGIIIILIAYNLPQEQNRVLSERDSAFIENNKDIAQE